MNNLMLRINRSRALRLTMVALLIVASSFSFVFAGPGDEIETAVKAGLKEIYTVITAIVVPVAVICAALAGYKFFVGGEKGAAQAKQILIYLAIGVAVVYLAPVVINGVRGIVEGYGTNTNVFN